MADSLTPERRSWLMSRVRGRHNKETELVFARLLRAARINGWRRHQPIPGRPDFIFRRQRVAVFVDGCYWHGCPQHYRAPKTNKTFWSRKIASNAARDRAVTKALRKGGWRVLRIWQHDLKNPARCVSRVAQLLLLRG